MSHALSAYCIPDDDLSTLHKFIRSVIPANPRVGSAVVPSIVEAGGPHTGLAHSTPRYTQLTANNSEIFPSPQSP